MRAGGGHGKGAQFERAVCKRLSLWVTQGVRDDLFWRTAMSGGRATLQLKNNIINKTQSGDIAAISVEGATFCEKSLFECKHYSDLNLASSFIYNTGLLHKFWREVVKSAKSYDKNPVLIAKQNRFPTLAIVLAADELFSIEPILFLQNWQAKVFLFEEATGYKRIIERRARKIK